MSLPWYFEFNYLIIRVVFQEKPQYNLSMRNSSRSLILLTASLILVTFLISHLSVPEFHNGIPMAEKSMEPPGESGGFLDSLIALAQNRRGDFSDEKTSFQDFLSTIMIPISIIILVIIAIGLLIRKELRQKVILRLLAALSALLFLIFIFYISRHFDDNNDQSGEMINTGIENIVADPGPENSPDDESPEPEIPQGISYLFSIIIVSAFITSVYFIVRKIRSLNRTGESPDIAAISQKALDDFESGDDFSDVILRCYSEMGHWVQTRMGIIRSTSMTPHEFQTHLLKEGLPRKEVEQLTMLFERVRYGREQLTKPEEKDAEICLKSLISSLEKK